MTLVTILLVTSSFLVYTEAASFIWLYSDSTVYLTQGEDAELSWSVDVGTGYTWDLVKISRNNIKSDFAEQDLIRVIAPATRKVYLTEREADLDLDIKPASSIVNVTFVLRNLTRDTDEKYYKILVQNSDRESDVKYTKLNVYVKPEFTSITALPEKRAFCSGIRVQINCTSIAHPPAVYSLYRNNTLVQNRSSSGYFNVTLNTVGNYRYTCVPSNTAGVGQIKSTEVLEVKEPPKITNCESDKTITAVEGERITFPCSISGSNPLNITWTDGTKEWNTRSLTFYPVSRRDNGTYWNLTVSNGEECPEAERKNIRLDVYLGAQSPVIYNPYKDFMVVDEGKDVSLICNATGYPVPNITWTKNGITVGVGKTLDITRAKKHDSACYTCKATNAIGQDKNASLCLTVQYPPSDVRIVSSSSRVTLREGDSLKLSCHSDSEPAPTFTWKHNGMLLSVGRNGTLLYETVYVRHSGSYICEAKNRIGSVQSSVIQIDVRYLDKPKVFGSSNKSYSQSNPEVWFNLSVNTYPNDLPMSCESSTSDLSTTISNLDSSGLNGKQYMVFVSVKNNVDNASISCKTKNGAVERQTTLYVYRQPTIFKEKLTGQFDITNIEWQDELKDSESTSYKNLENKCMRILQAAYEDISYVVVMKVKTFVKGSVIVQFQLDIIDGISDPLIPLKTLIKGNGGNINGLAIAYESVQESKGIKEDAMPKDNNKTLSAVLGALFALSLVLNMFFIAFFFWMRQKESNDKLIKRPDNNDETGNVNDLALQETSFNSTDNVTAPEYQPVDSLGLAASSAGVPEYEAGSTITRTTQQPSPVLTYSMTEYEIADGQRENNPQEEEPDRSGQSQGLPKQLLTNAPSMYQTIQSQSVAYSSLSPLTKLPTKNTQSSIPNTNGEYQTIKKKNVSPQYQSLDDLSRC